MHTQVKLGNIRHLMGYVNYFLLTQKRSYFGCLTLGTSSVGVILAVYANRLVLLCRQSPRVPTESRLCRKTPDRTDTVDMKPSRARGHDFSIYKLGCKLDVRKYPFRHRVTSQWNNLPDSVVNADSMNSFKNRLDKFWNDSEVMYNPDTNIWPAEP